MPRDPGLPPERRPRNLAEMRFYVDEDLLGTGYSLMWARRDVITCGVPLISEELPRGTPDVEWIPRVAAHGWVAITGNERTRSSRRWRSKRS